MKLHMMIGAMIVSAGLCSQAFSFELLDRMLGGDGCGCCDSCQPKCCAPKCCKPACKPACCEPKCCEPACNACDPCNSCNSCNDCCDLFGGLRGLLCRKPSCKCNDCCDPCGNGCGCEAKEEPACEAAPASCCDPCNSCCKKKCGKGLLEAIFSNKCGCCNKCNDCCNSCGGCDSGCGCGGGEGGAAAAAGDAAPVPPAPVPAPADPSASYRKGGSNLRPVKFVR